MEHLKKFALGLLLAAVLMVHPAASAETVIHGVPYPQDAAVLDLRGEAVSDAELRSLLSQLPELQQVDVRDTGISQKEMKALCREYPNIRFLWVIHAFDRDIPSDCTELDLSGIEMEQVEPVEELLEFLPDVKKVDMCGCGIDNDTMDALNRRYDDIQIVWAVPYGTRSLRTDIEWFLPFMYSVARATNDETSAGLRYCTELVAVDLGHMDITDISWVKYTPKLKYLVIGDTPIADISPLAGLDSLVYLEVFHTNVTDYTPLLSCKQLEDLNISYTNGDPAVIQQMTWLKHLWWHMPWTIHSDYEEGWYEMKDHVQEMLPDTTASFRCTGSSTSHGWRNIPNYYAQRDAMGMWYMEG